MSERAPLIDLLYRVRQFLMETGGQEELVTEIEGQLDWLHELDRKQEQFFNSLMRGKSRG